MVRQRSSLHASPSLQGCPPSVIGPSLCCCPYLEQSAATCHVRTLYDCFQRSPQSFPLQAFLTMTFTASFIVLRSDSFHFRILKSLFFSFCFASCATIGDRVFPATSASVWNRLLESIRASPLLSVFRSSLKIEIFARSYSYRPSL